MNYNGHYFDDMELQAYRSGDYKVKKPYSGFPGAAWKQKVPAHDSLLINLKEDMGEQHNLYPEQPDFGISLFEEMNQARKELGAFPAPLIIRTGADNSHYRYLEQKHKQEK